MRLLDRVIARMVRGPVEALVAQKVAEQVAELKLDALYSYRWHGDRSRLHIPDSAVVNNALFNMSGGTITIGEYAFFGHDVAVLTGTHDIEKFGRERQLAFPREGRDVVIGDGVWLASHTLVPIAADETHAPGSGATGSSDFPAPGGTW